MSFIGKLLVTFGALLVAAGILLVLTSRGILPRLPGDLSFKLGQSGQVWIPLGTCILLSIVLTVLLNLIERR